MDYTKKQIEEVKRHIANAKSRTSTQTEKTEANKAIIEFHNTFAAFKYSYEKVSCKSCTMMNVIKTVIKKIALYEREQTNKARAAATKREEEKREATKQKNKISTQKKNNRKSSKD